MCGNLIGSGLTQITLSIASASECKKQTKATSRLDSNPLKIFQPNVYR